MNTWMHTRRTTVIDRNHLLSKFILIWQKSHLLHWRQMSTYCCSLLLLWMIIYTSYSEQYCCLSLWNEVTLWSIFFSPQWLLFVGNFQKNRWVSWMHELAPLFCQAQLSETHANTDKAICKEAYGFDKGEILETVLNWNSWVFFK